MLRRTLAAAIALATAAGVAACATSGSSGSPSNSSSNSSSARPTTASPAQNAALCSSAAHLRASLAALQQVDVVHQGTSALVQAITPVKNDVAALADAARNQYSQQITTLQNDSKAVQAAVEQAKASPTAHTVGAVATAARTLVKDGQAVLASVGSSC
jgi:hypothetical protein